MQREIQLQVLPEIAHDEANLKKVVAKKANIPYHKIDGIELLKRSIDARKKPVKFNLKVRVYSNEAFKQSTYLLPDYPNVENEKPVVIIGAGPAGLFAALKCIELGKKPIIIERGKSVSDRRRDLKAINIDHIVNEDSNYCFGEGGAGTYSDGKLYTRSKKRGDVQRILELLVAFGATSEILVEAHPHIGTNKLPAIIQSIRECIVANGGEVLFNTKMVDIQLQGKSIKGITVSDGSTITTEKVVLATGHSARDIFNILDNRKIAIEVKPFALGVRVEHPQLLIDQIQYHSKTRSEYLPPSPYSIVKQVSGRGVYSFCMCPGGVIAPCATKQNEVVTNGWSPSKRDMKTANSGIVVALELSDFKAYEKYGNLAGMHFQSAIEQKAWLLAGKTQKVPAQRLVDFTRGIVSNHLPKTSYKPGITSINIEEVLPDFIYEALKGGFKAFGKTMKGYFTNEAIVHAPESRTSSPVRIPRDRESLQHIEIEGLYPCGEGAGYAGGIISAAIDGEKCAEKCVESMLSS